MAAFVPVPAPFLSSPPTASVDAALQWSSVAAIRKATPNTLSSTNTHTHGYTHLQLGVI